MIDYYLLTKPGIIFGNLFTFAAGFALGSKGNFDLQLFFLTLIALGLVIASACVFNNVIDKSIDQKMERTKERALAKGSIALPAALAYGSILGITGSLLLLAFTPLPAFLFAIAGFAIYVFIYSFSKRKTIYATAIGSIAGAIPPVVGYTAASGTVDLGALLFFLMMVLWQMPHFYAIALMHLNDYSKAGLPLLPIVKGVHRTKIQMALYIIAFVPVVLLFTLFHYTGLLFFIVTGILGTVWLALAVQGLIMQDNQIWNRNMFLFSLVIMAVICLLIPVEVMLNLNSL